MIIKSQQEMLTSIFYDAYGYSDHSAQLNIYEDVYNVNKDLVHTSQGSTCWFGKNYSIQPDYLLIFDIPLVQIDEVCV